MTRWIITRLLAAFATMFIASLAIFGILRLIPGDPIAAITAGTRLNSEQKDAVRESLGLNQGFIRGYAQWIGGILQGDFGQSPVSGTSVNELISARLPTTATLVVFAAVLSLSIGLGIALMSAVRPGLIDRIGLVITSVSIATPSFVVALILLAIFAVQLRWFPAAGTGSGIGDMIYHLTLPALTLAIVTFGLIARVTRASFQESLASERVEVARSRGIANRSMLFRHVVRNSYGQIMTLTALLVASLFIGAAVVEFAFGLQGVGYLLVTSIGRRDFPTVQAISLIAVGLFVVTSTVADILLPLIDPRVRKVGAH